MPSRESSSILTRARLDTFSWLQQCQRLFILVASYHEIVHSICNPEETKGLVVVSFRDTHCIQQAEGCSDDNKQREA
jgi:hypothetical protein